MVFKRLLGALGVGGPTVDTVLDAGAARPGGSLTGRVHIKGGDRDAEIAGVTLELVARVEAEHAEGESEGVVGFGRFVVGGGFRLGAGEERDVPFSVTLPWETPVTELHGQPLGVVLGVRTELEVAGARDKGDLDPLAVAPLPAQEAVLEAFGQLGFGFRSADLEYGRIAGTGQELPFYQELELVPAPDHADRIGELELTFLASPAGLEVVLEADRHGGLLSGGHDALARFTVPHDQAEGQDWNALVDGWVRQLVDPAPRTAYAYGHHGHDGHHGSHDHDDHHGHGRGGYGGAVAAGAAGLAVGVAGGMVAAEVVDEVGDLVEDEDDDEGAEEA
ncbi:sporulation protein [Streptomyces sp. NPDC002640]